MSSLNDSNDVDLEYRMSLFDKYLDRTNMDKKQYHSKSHQIK